MDWARSSSESAEWFVRGWNGFSRSVETARSWIGSWPVTGGSIKADRADNRAEDTDVGYLFLAMSFLCVA